MANEIYLTGFCRWVLKNSQRRDIADPMLLAKFFRRYAEIERTPSLKRTVELVRALGIVIEEADYLSTAGANMTARGVWYIHYAAKDRPATQKFTIFHELFEILQKSCADLDAAYYPPKEPQMSRSAERFASAVLLSPQFLISHLVATGCDVVKLADGLELSQQCLLIAMEQHLKNIPFWGALFDYQLPDGLKSRQKTHDYNTTLVVKSLSARRQKIICRLQPEPILRENPSRGSLVCAAAHGGSPVFYRGLSDGDSAVLVRPLFSGSRTPSRIILLALPNVKSNRFFPQVDSIQAIIVNEHSSCPAAYKCRNSLNCVWKQ